MQYMLLILRTFRQYAGLVWQRYDVAFREQAAASKLTDWLQIDVQLFNFHAAGATARNVRGGPNTSGDEPRGNQRSIIQCTSWNSGKCMAPTANCKFSHSCSTCTGGHRRIDCSESQESPREKRRSRSPSPASHKHKKR